MNQAAHISAPPIWESPDRRGFIRIEKISKAFGDFVAWMMSELISDAVNCFLFWAVPVAVNHAVANPTVIWFKSPRQQSRPTTTHHLLGRTSVFVLAPKRRGCAYPLAVRSPGAWAQTHWREF